MRFFKFLALNAAIAASLCCSFAFAQSTDVPSARFRPLPCGDDGRDQPVR